MVKTTGYGCGSRKSHCSTIYKDTLMVYGGQSETGFFYNEMIVLYMETLEWVKIDLKRAMIPFTQGACCSVSAPKRDDESEMRIAVSNKK